MPLYIAILWGTFISFAFIPKQSVLIMQWCTLLTWKGTLMNTFTIPTATAPVSFDVFLAKMLPHFRSYARRVLLLQADNFDDAVQDMTAIAFDIYRSLVRRGKPAYYSPIMRFAIKYYRVGRRFMGSNTVDVLSPQTQILERCTVSPLSMFVGSDEMDFMEDRRQQDVADATQMSMDYEAWLTLQSPRDQDIIRALSYGHSTSEVAKMHGLSATLISQYRKRYAESWNTYISDKEPA